MRVERGPYVDQTELFATMSKSSRKPDQICTDGGAKLRRADSRQSQDSSCAVTPKVGAGRTRQRCRNVPRDGTEAQDQDEQEALLPDELRQGSVIPVLLLESSQIRVQLLCCINLNRSRLTCLHGSCTGSGRRTKWPIPPKRSRRPRSRNRC